MNQDRAAKMIQLYFAQGDHYYSGSKGEMLKIVDMHPMHAANAAAHLLADAETWATDAQATGKPIWFVLRSALFEALCERVRGTEPEVVPVTSYHCNDCNRRLRGADQAYIHMIRTKHSLTRTTVS